MSPLQMSAIPPPRKPVERDARCIILAKRRGCPAKCKRSLPSTVRTGNLASGFFD